jgi:AraC-like DNA-binding protein
MSQLFSTELLAPSDRIDAWQWNAQQICGDCRIRLPKCSFHGSIEIRHVGGLPLTRFSSSPLSFWKEPLDTADTEKRSCIVITQLAGMRRYQQNAQDVLLKPGDSTLIDTARPWSSSCGTDCVRLYLRVPRWMMEKRLQMRKIPIARRIWGGSGMGCSLFRLSQCLYDEAKRMQDDQVAIALDAYFEILAACIRGDESRVQPGSRLSGRILQFIDTHASEPTLGPVEIASTMGISVRHLHRLFAVTGKTLGEHIRSRRLEQCRKDLADPRFREKTITEIAFCCGFSDAAHFSHSFRRHFGVSPRAFRSQSKTKEGSAFSNEAVRGFTPEAESRYFRAN